MKKKPSPEPPEDPEAEEQRLEAAKLQHDAWIRKLNYTQVCEWLAALGVNENSIQVLVTASGVEVVPCHRVCAATLTDAPGVEGVRIPHDWEVV